MVPGRPQSGLAELEGMRMALGELYSDENRWAGSVPQAADQASRAFDQISHAAKAAWKVAPGWETRLRPVLSRLLMLGQARDAFEQRLRNLLDALGAARGRGALGAAPFHMVVAMQMDALAALLERTAEEATGGIEALAETGAAPPDEEADPAGQLFAAADILRAEAETHRDWPCQPEGHCDLGWMAALYKTDDERRVHRAALARI